MVAEEKKREREREGGVDKTACGRSPHPVIDVPASCSWPTIDKMMLTGAARSHYDLDPSFPGTTARYTRARETFHDQRYRRLGAVQFYLLKVGGEAAA